MAVFPPVWKAYPARPLLAVLGALLLLGGGLPWGLRPLRGAEFALLIGINDYPLQPLSGAKNDVLAMRQMLEREYGFPAEQITMLLDKQATLATVRSHLRRFAAQIQPADTFVLHFSGHGSHVPDDSGDEGADGRDETLVLLSDDGTQLAHLLDDELGEHLDRLAAREVVVILDACHSGTGTKDIASGRIRYWWPQPSVEAPSAETQTQPLSRERSVEESGTPLDEPHPVILPNQRRIVISACKASQKAPELHHPDAHYGMFTGALSYYLIAGLRGPADINGDGRVSYREAYRYSCRRIDEVLNQAKQEESERQTPVIEAGSDSMLDAPAFGVERKTAMYARGVSAAGGEGRLDLGAIHGLRAGQILGVYSLDDLPRLAEPPLAELEVQSIQFETATVAVPARLGLPPDWITAPILNPLARPDVYLSTAVETEGLTAEARRILVSVNERLSRIAWVRLDAAAPDLQVRITQVASTEALHVRIFSGDGRVNTGADIPLVSRPLPEERRRTVDQILALLEPRLEEYRLRRRYAGLTNPRPGFGLTTRVYHPSAAEYPVFAPGQGIKFSMLSTADCHFYLLLIGPDGQAKLWYPQGGHEDHHLSRDRMQLKPGPGKVLTVEGPAGVYMIKMLAVLAEHTLEGAVRDGLPDAAFFAALSPDAWAETSVSFRVQGDPP